MLRRDFIALLGGATAWPLGVRAQSMPVIGFLNSASARGFGRLLSAFREGLKESGYVEGVNVALEYRWAEGNYDRLRAMAADLVRRRVDLIAATGGSVSARAAKAETSTTSIVFAIGFDPVQLGLVASFNRPGGNATGVTLYTKELIGKRLELLRELMSGTSQIAMLVNPIGLAAELEVADMEAVARAAGLHLIVLKAKDETEFEAAFASAVQQKAGAMLVSADPFFTDRREQIVALAARHAMPAAYPWRVYAEAGGLMSYGTNLSWAYRQIGDYAGRILKGAKPGELPVQLPTTFDLVINRKAVRALGITVPRIILAGAEVIE
jgi:ABC-type uncharacterized transport system substrate-binding protein